MKKRITKPILCLLTLLLAAIMLQMVMSAAGGEAFYIGNAIHFAKTQDTLYYSGHISDQLDNLTMETWVKPTTDFSNMAIENIRIMYNGNSGTSGYGIYLHGPNKSPSILFGCIGWLVASNVKLTQNQWCHLAATRDSLASGGRWHLYVNGVEQALTQDFAGINQTPRGYTNENESFSIGNNMLVSENFTGCFDEVRFWNVCRTADEIKNSMYTKPDTDAEPNLIAYYNFESTTGFTVSPGGNNTALSGVPVPNMAKSGGYNLTAAGFSLTGSVSNFVNSVALGSFGFQNAAASVKENTGAIAATITRTGGSEGSVSIYYQTQDGTGDSAALSGTHYTATQGTITFGEGETSKVIMVPIINDSLDGTDRHFTIMLTGPNGVTISPATATVTITPKAKISTAIDGITLPDKGGTPVLSLNTKEYTASVAWSPSHTEFQSGTQYTATITLTPQFDYTLKGVSDNAFQISGALNAQYTAGTGKIIAKFPGIPYDAPTVGEGYSIDYKNETVSIYSGYEASGDSGFSSLLTSGCSITSKLGQTLYIRKAASGEIPASAGTSFAIPARPAAPADIGTINESVLGAEDGKITNVDSTMEYKQDAQTVWTAITGTEIANLPGGIYQVRYKSDAGKFASDAAQIAINSNATVGESTIAGITPPAAGLVPGASVTETAQYTGTVTWSPDHAVFQSGNQYTATITLTPKADYTFTGVPENSFTVPGALATNPANSGIITAKFPGLPFDAPADGEGYNIDYINETILLTNGYQAGTDSGFVSLISSGSITGYLGQTVYIRKAASGEIPASTGTGLTIPARPAAPADIGTINESFLGAGDGKITNVDSTMEYKQDAQTVWTAITGTEIAKLPGGIYQVRYKSGTGKFASETIQVAINSNATVGESTIAGITPPAAGLVPGASVTETAQYTGTVTWSPDHAVFQSGNQYTATITLTPKDDYTFTGVPENSFTVPGALATNPANSGIITAVFPGLPFDAPADGEGYNIDYLNETILITNGYQAGTDSSFTSLIPSGSVTGYLGQTVYMRKAASGEIPASTGTGVAIPARLTAPTGIGTANESYPDAGDGKITNVDSRMEYKKDAEPAWTGITGFELTGLSGGTYYIRLKAADKDIDAAVAAESFASLATSVTVQTTGTTPEPTPAAGIDYEAEQLTGLIANAKYLIDGGSYTADANGELALQTLWFGNTSLSLVKRGNGTTTTDSTAQSLPIPVRPAAVPTVKGHAQVGSVKGKITGVTTEMEYNDGSNWIACTGDSITDLAAGTYHVRYRASNTAKKFASGAADVVITKISVTQVPGEVTDPGSVGVEPIGEAFSDSVEVRIQKSSVTDDAIRDAIKTSPALRDNSLSMLPIDISIYVEGTDTRVQPNEGTSVKITYPVPVELLSGRNRLIVVCIENGKLVILPTKAVKRGNIECIEFTATHFSPYAIIDNRGALSYSPSETITSDFPQNNQKPTIPETGFDTLDWIIWSVFGHITVLFF